MPDRSSVGLARRHADAFTRLFNRHHLAAVGPFGAGRLNRCPLRLNPLLRLKRIGSLPNEGQRGFGVSAPAHLEVLARKLVVLRKERLDLVQHAGTQVGQCLDVGMGARLHGHTEQPVVAFPSSGSPPTSRISRRHRHSDDRQPKGQNSISLTTRRAAKGGERTLTLLPEADVPPPTQPRRRSLLVPHLKAVIRRKPLILHCY